MPRIDGDELLAHIKSKAGRVKCPVCRRGPMEFSDSVYRVPEAWVRSNMDQEIVQLLVVLTCDNCGGVSFINPFAAGLELISDEEPTDKRHELK